MADPDKAAGRAPGGGRTPRRRLARLAAVQALYQIDLNGDPVEAVVKQFVQHRLGQDMDGVMLDADAAFFVELVRGAAAGRARFDGMIGSAMAAGRDPKKLEVVLRAILRAGAFELAERADVPPRVAIAEYVDITADFFSDKEAALTNAILDRIARVVRAEELGDGAAEGLSG